jgi:hypothetical protein
MRLLNVKTLQLEDPIYPSADSFPQYTISSHTWGEEEVSFQDLTSGKAGSLAGYKKLVGCCAKSKAEGFEHTWYVHTCTVYFSFGLSREQNDSRYTRMRRL